MEQTEHLLIPFKAKGAKVEDVRVDEATGKRFLFFWDPDELPLELYQA